MSVEMRAAIDQAEEHGHKVVLDLDTTSVTLDGQQMTVGEFLCYAQGFREAMTWCNENCI